MNTLKVVSYNTEFSRQVQSLLANLISMRDAGVDVFCLQEVCRYKDKRFFIDLLLEKFGKDWKAEFNLSNESEYLLNHGVAIVWNNEKLKLQNIEKVFLPKDNSLPPLELFISLIGGFSNRPVPRKALIATFQLGNEKVRITSIHLDFTGGLKKRMRQMKYFLNHLQSKEDTKSEIVCGDLNTFDTFNTGREHEEMLRLFKKYSFVDASSKVKWSIDLMNAGFGKGVLSAKRILSTINLHIYKKLDYIWSKNLKVLHSKRIDVPGSDHFPVMAEFEINNSNLN